MPSKPEVTTGGGLDRRASRLAHGTLVASAKLLETDTSSPTTAARARAGWRDGKELFFLSADRQIVVVSVKCGTEIDFELTTGLFRSPTSYRSLAR
jgi:hypothetical protein